MPLLTPLQYINSIGMYDYIRCISLAVNLNFAERVIDNLHKILICFLKLYIAIGGVVKIFSATALVILGMKRLYSRKAFISCLKKIGSVPLIPQNRAFLL